MQLLICIGPFLQERDWTRALGGLERRRDGVAGESERKTRREKNKMNEADELSHPAGERAEILARCCREFSASLSIYFFNGQATNGIDHYGTCEMPKVLRVKVSWREAFVIN